MDSPFEKYKQLVIEYQKLLIELRKRYNDRAMKEPMLYFDIGDYDTVRIRSIKLSTAENILSIDEKQQKEIWEECKSITGLIETWK